MKSRKIEIEIEIIETIAPIRLELKKSINSSLQTHSSDTKKSSWDVSWSDL